ncbi:MAG: hypothetical protein AAF193_04680, partial [Bacteroidota bacterium]
GSSYNNPPPSIKGIGFGGIKAGVAKRWEFTPKLHSQIGALFHFQRIDLVYQPNPEQEYRMRMYPLTLEVPVHLSLDLVRPENSVSALFGIRFNQALKNNSSFITLKDQFWAFDIGLGKEFSTEKSTFQPAIIYSLGATDVFQFSNVETLSAGASPTIYVHQLSLQFRW